jgi:hypothetical protein
MNPRKIDGIRRDSTTPQHLRYPIITPPAARRASRTLSVGRIWALLLLACALFWALASFLLASLAR